MLLRQSFSMGSSDSHLDIKDGNIEVNKEGFKNDISMLSDSLPLQSSSSKSTTADNNASNANVAALQIQSSSSNSSQKLSVSSKDNSINGHSTSNHSTSNSTNHNYNTDRPPRVRTSSNGSNVTNSNPGSANNSPKQRSPKPPLLQCVTDSNGGTGQQFPSSPLGKKLRFYKKFMCCVCVMERMCSCLDMKLNNTKSRTSFISFPTTHIK